MVTIWDLRNLKSGISHLKSTSGALDKSARCGCHLLVFLISDAPVWRSYADFGHGSRVDQRGTS